MFSGIRRAFGLIKVEETATEIEISGIPADILARDIAKMWNTQRINKEMFSAISRSSLRFPKFFAIEVHYMLQQVDKYRNARSTSRTIRSIIAELEEKTWLKRLNVEPVSRIDLTQLAHLNAKLFPHQDGFLANYGELTERYGLNGYLLSAEPGTGKAQPLDAPIRVPGGWSTMGDMSVGTKIIAKDGSVTEVTGVYPQGEKLIYRITFADGRSTECCGEHLWKVRWRGNGRLQSMDVVDTQTIAATLALDADHRFHVPLIDPEERPEKDLPIDPYALGLLIGDGHLCKGKVHLSTPDQFILDELKQILPPELTVDHIQKYDYRVKAQEGRSNSYLQAVRILGLAEKLSIDKFVPQEYMDGSIAQRKAILQGLMDTDGTVDRYGSVSYSTSSKRLAENVQQLVWSLGGIASISSRIPHYTYRGERLEGKRAYRVFIRYPKPSDLFRLPRKRQLTKDDGQYVGSLMLKIVSIEPIGMKPAQCISIAHPERLYVTSDYIVTHNTIMGLAAAECLHSDLTIIVSPKNALYRVWVSTIQWLYKKPRAFWVASEGKPWKGERMIITHYEGLAKALDVVKRISHQKAVVILDESHNLNELKSQRTQLFLDICKAVNTQNVLWSSGTPLKAMGYEMLPLLRSIDPLFTDDVEKRFLRIFGKASDRALDILRNRIGKVSYHVSGAEVIDVKKRYEQLKIQIPNGDEFTLDSIREQMRKFVEERMKHYESNMKSYRKKYEDGLEAYRLTMDPSDKSDLREYERAVAYISRGFDTADPKALAYAQFANQFENKKILPSIKDKETREGFKDARSVIKYVFLKVVGEALGKIVGGARVKCHVEMVKRVNWKAIAEKSAKKVIVFSSYVEVIKQVEIELKKAGYNCLMVYGDTNSNVAGIVKQFGDDPNSKFLAATYQSLSTAVPLTMADLTVYVNQPFRSYERDQADARTARIGQDSEVTYVDLYLDTGKEPNISTRSKDILDWSREQVMAMGVGSGDNAQGVAAELNKDYTLGAMEAYKEPETEFSLVLRSYLSFT